MIKKISFIGKKVFIDELTFELEYPIQDAFIHDHKIIIFYNPDSYTKKFGQFDNLIAVNEKGEVHWIAELPTNYPSDRYVYLHSKEPIIVDSFSSFECTINPDTGKIMKKIFFK